MSPTLRPSLDTLVAQYGSIAAIPEAVLAACGYTCFTRQVTGDTTIVDRAWPAKAKKLAVWMQRKYEGYFFADDLQRLINTVAGTDLVNNRDLACMKKRAETFIAAGIPPIFARRFCMHFPLIDFLIQYGSGSHERRAKAKASQRVSTKLNPASIMDVCLFRSAAFLDDGTIEEALIRELLYHCTETYDFKNEDTRVFVLTQTEAAMRFLGEALRDLPHEPRRYIDILPGTEEGVMNERRWYLRVRPEKREELVRAFLAKLTREETPQRLRILRARIEPVFPGWCTEQTVQVRAERRAEEKMRENDQRVEHAIQTLNFRGVPVPCFEREPWASPLHQAIERYVTEVIAQLDEQGLQILCNCARETIHFHLLKRLPPSLNIPDVCWALLRQYREERVRRMSDEEFLIIFADPTMLPMRVGALGSVKKRGATEELPYWHEVRGRLKRLRPDD